MKVLITAWSWSSHYLPMVTLGWSLSAAGHDVVVAAPPGLVDTVLASGLTPIQVGRDADVLQIAISSMDVEIPQGGPGAEQWQRMRASKGAQSLAMFAKIAETTVFELVDFGRQWQPDVIVHDTTTYAGALAARVLGVPAVRSLFGLDMTYQGREFEPLILGPLCDKLGIEPTDTVGDLTVDPCPPTIQLPTSPQRTPIRFTSYNGAGRMERWLLDPPARTRVCITGGTSLPSFGRAMFFVDEVVDALHDRDDLELVVAVSRKHRDILGPLPDGVRVTESMPLSVLLPTCDAVIGHAGHGTALSALHAGLPQVTIPQLPDQQFMSEALARSGAAIELHRESLTRESVRDAVDRLIDDPAMREATEGLRAEMAAAPPASEVVGRIEELVGGHS